MWRTKKAEESLKNSVLDEEAAARFSTAAALAAGSGRSAEQANLLATREPSPEAVSDVAACIGIKNEVLKTRFSNNTIKYLGKIV